MAVTRQEISGWFDQGVKDGREFMIIVCDTFDYEDYPVYSSRGRLAEEMRNHDGKNMQRIMEVYDLKKPKEAQMNATRAWEVPEKEK